MTGEASPPPPRPASKSTRLWLEVTVEVADEMALRTFDLHPVGNPDGGMTGLRDMDLDALAASAVGQVIAEALRAAQPATGLRWSHTTGPCVRPQDDPSGGGS